MRYLLYNPFSGEESFSHNSAVSYSETVNLPTNLMDITKLESLRGFFEGLESDDDAVIFGGDGSLNKVANELSDLPLKNDVYYYPCGTGNDFARDVGVADGQELIYVNDYIKKLPVVAVNGVESKFINGVGFGIDGYCCEIGDKLKSQHKKPNYTAIITPFCWATTLTDELPASRIIDEYRFSSSPYSKAFTSTLFPSTLTSHHGCSEYALTASADSNSTVPVPPLGPKRRLFDTIFIEDSTVSGLYSSSHDAMNIIGNRTDIIPIIFLIEVFVCISNLFTV